MTDTIILENKTTFKDTIENFRKSLGLTEELTEYQYATVLSYIVQPAPSNRRGVYLRSGYNAYEDN